MQQVIQYISDNLIAITLIWQSLFIALSGACELFGLTKLSKIFGTTAVLDLGRVLRYAKMLLDLIAASKQAQLAKSVAKIGLVVFLAALSSGCSFLRSPTFWDGIEKTCEVALTATPEVKAKALATGTPVEEIAAIVCAVADVVDPFIRAEMASKEGHKLTGESPAQQAVAIARVKGLL